MDPELNQVGHRSGVEIPPNTDRNDVVYINWGDLDLPSNVVVLRRYTAREYLEAEAKFKWQMGREDDFRSDHEWAADVIRGLIVSIDGADPLAIDSRLLVPLAWWSYRYSKGLGLQPVPLAQPAS